MTSRACRWRRFFRRTSADIGDQTAHGVADTKIMQGLCDWIEAHATQVAGCDPKLRAAPQIDKLTDAQIRGVAHDLDPQFKAR